MATTRFPMAIAGAISETSANSGCSAGQTIPMTPHGSGIASVTFRNVTLAMPEPWGVMGMVCPAEHPLLALVSLIAPAIAMGNRVVAIPSWRFPLLATDFYQVLDTSDVPPGVVNIVTGHPDELAKVLAQHDDVAALWYVGSARFSAIVERESIGNLKATWVNDGKRRNWLDDHQARCGPADR